MSRGAGRQQTGHVEVTTVACTSTRAGVEEPTQRIGIKAGSQDRFLVWRGEGGMIGRKCSDADPAARVAGEGVATAAQAAARSSNTTAVARGCAQQRNEHAPAVQPLGLWSMDTEPSEHEQESIEPPTGGAHGMQEKERGVQTRLGVSGRAKSKAARPRQRRGASGRPERTLGCGRMEMVCSSGWAWAK